MKPNPVNPFDDPVKMHRDEAFYESDKKQR